MNGHLTLGSSLVSVATYSTGLTNNCPYIKDDGRMVCVEIILILSLIVLTFYGFFFFLFMVPFVL